MSVLPPLYAGWMEELLPGPIPRESKSTCSQCAMCAPADGRPDKSGLFFNPHAKCCTYLPELHNFLVGGARIGYRNQGPGCLVLARTRAVEKEYGMRLSRDLIRKLIDFDVLTAEPEALLPCRADIPRG